MNIKVFEGESGHLCHSLNEKQYELLLVSQFTLVGTILSNDEMSFVEAAKPSMAKELYKNCTGF
jgi:D-tyrosyl-tRNA(Tyr) deacylase